MACSLLGAGAGRSFRLAFVASYLALHRGKNFWPRQVQLIRFYAKGRNKEKKPTKKGSIGGGGIYSFSNEVLDLGVATSEINDEMDSFKDSIVSQISLRTDLRAYEQLAVTLEDGSTRMLQQLGTIRKKATFLEVALSLPEYQKPVTLAIAKSALNVNPQQEHNTVIIPLPKPTKQHREELVKKTDVLFHKCQDRINAVYSKHSRKISDYMTAGSAPKDDVHEAEKVLLQLKRSAVQRAKEIAAQKKKELTEETI